MPELNFEIEQCFLIVAALRDHRELLQHLRSEGEKFHDSECNDHCSFCLVADILRDRVDMVDRVLRQLNKYDIDSTSTDINYFLQGNTEENQ